MLYPELCNKDVFSKDAVNRIQEYTHGIGAPIGAYTANSKGYPYMRQKVCDYISKKDGGLHSNPDDIYLTNGASEVVALAYQMLIRNPNDGIMIPIPQYPLYSAQMTLESGTLVPYYLDEESGWTIDSASLVATIKKARSEGTIVRALVAINPGNPTGQVLKRECLENMVKICYEENIMLVAD